MTKEEIIDIIADLYEEKEISELGFDLKQYCNKAGILLIPYSSFAGNSKKLVQYDEDGFNILNSESNYCEIYYNDEIKPKLRIKFTVPHEIGHISLGHNLVFGKGETPKQKREADIFANEFYCPQVLIIYFDLLTKSKLMSTFGITEAYANTLLDKISERSCMKFSLAEKRLLRIFLKNRENKKKT